jgi:hypothetical protein
MTNCYTCCRLARAAITTGTELPKSTYPTVSCIATEVIFLIFTVATPILWMIAMLVTWLAPLPGRAKVRMAPCCCSMQKVKPSYVGALYKMYHVQKKTGLRGPRKWGYVVTRAYVSPGIPQYVMVRATEFLFGWSTVDVYLVSIGAAVVELHQLAEGTMPDFCKAIAELPLGGESVWPE